MKKLLMFVCVGIIGITFSCSKNSTVSTEKPATDTTAVDTTMVMPDTINNY